jgi:hypothetical protein
VRRYVFDSGAAGSEGCALAAFNEDTFAWAVTGGLNHCIFDRSGHLSHAPAHPQFRLTLRTATRLAEVPDVTPILAAIIVHEEHVGTDLNALCVSGTQILVNPHLHRCRSPPRSGQSALPDPVSPGLCRPVGAGSRGKSPRAVSHGQASRPGEPDAVAQRDRHRTFAPHVPPLRSARDEPRPTRAVSAPERAIWRGDDVARCSAWRRRDLLIHRSWTTFDVSFCRDCSVRACVGVGEVVGRSARRAVSSGSVAGGAWVGARLFRA